jgi:hypothetical protein
MRELREYVDAGNVSVDELRWPRGERRVRDRCHWTREASHRLNRCGHRSRNFADDAGPLRALE